jgi:two-component system LytT family sensor kinase
MWFRQFKTVSLVEVLLHVLFWAFITLLPLLLRPAVQDARMLFTPWHLLCINLLLAAHFYLNAFVLIPQFLNKRNQPWLYIFLLLISFAVIDFGFIYTKPSLPFDIHKPPYAAPPFIAHFNILPLMAVTAAAFAYHFLTNRFKQINKSRDITNSALVSELAFLRSQISPHFIFNVINSIVALSRINPPAVEPTLMQLSQLMRYMLYVNNEEKITLKQKEQYLRSYIDLQKLRFEDTVEVNFNFDIRHPEQTIEPMLIIPFIENAFKYGTGNIKHPVIKGNIQATAKMLLFNLSNSYNPADQPHDDIHHGIGLNNVQRRLDLLYPGKHTLNITQDAGIYNVNLQIQFI